MEKKIKKTKSNFKKKVSSKVWRSFCIDQRTCAELLQSYLTLGDPPRQAPLSMGFSRQEYWSGLPFPSPGDLPDPGIEPRSPAAPALQADSSVLSHCR